MEFKEYLATEVEARAFAKGLELANHGDIHSIKVKRCDLPGKDFFWKVYWTDENAKTEKS